MSAEPWLDKRVMTLSEAFYGGNLRQWTISVKPEKAVKAGS